MSRFTANDYLNWFATKSLSFEPPKMTKVKIPKQRNKLEETVPLPLYKCRELGQHYVDRYHQQHVRETLESEESLPNTPDITSGGEQSLCMTGDVSSLAEDESSLTHSLRRVNLNQSVSSSCAAGASAFPQPEISLLDDESDTETLAGDEDVCDELDPSAETPSTTNKMPKKNTPVTVDYSLSALEEDTMQGSVAGALSLDTAVMAQEQLKVFQQYNFAHRDAKTEQLPVFKYKDEILNKIRGYRVVVIEGRTGCGKSTQVAQYILDEGRDEGYNVNICVTQPRKIAAVTLARRVCEERKWKLGSLVGYQVGLDNCTTEDTRLSYVTTEVLVQKLIVQKSLDQFTHIILDEVHERDQHTDFALLIVKKLLNTVSRNVKVILMSATIEADKFAKYFSTPVMGRLLPAPIVSINDMSQFNTEIYYLDHLAPIFREKMGSLMQESEPWVSEELSVLVVEIVQRFDRIDTLPSQGSSDELSTRGAVLVFVPGLMEIELIITKMRACAADNKWMLFPLHSSITLNEQEEAFAQCPLGYRKVIIATNIAESSITVSDVRYVIDLCMTKTLHCDPITNYTCLKLDWASKASCDQRAGRTGRTGNGRVYRMITHFKYKNLPNYTTPELLRCPLSVAVLKTKRLCMGEPAALLALALDPPNIADIARTILDLKQLGCLCVSPEASMSALDGELTYLGELAAQLPLDPRLSKLIVLGQALGCLREAIIIGEAELVVLGQALGCLRDSSWSPIRRDEGFSYRRSNISGHCTMKMLVWRNLHGREAFREFGGKAQRDHSSFRPHLSGASRRPINDSGVTSSEVQWAKKSYVQLQQLREVQKLVEELTDRLKYLRVVPLNLQNPVTDHQQTVLKLCIAGAFFPHYFRRCRSDDYERETNIELNGHDPYNTVIVRRLPVQSAVLYEPQIRELFKECSTDVAIEIENSKAYVMFRRARSAEGSEEAQQSIPGEFPTAMYIALKMVQVPRFKDALQINLFSAVDTERLLAVLEEERSAAVCTAAMDASSSIDGNMSNSTLSLALSGISSDMNSSRQSSYSYSRVLRYGGRQMLSARTSGFRPAELPPSDQLSWRITIVYVETAGRVWARSDKCAAEHLQFVSSTINLALQSVDDQDVPGAELTGDRLAVNEPVLAPRTNAEGATQYARAQIEERPRGFNSAHARNREEKLIKVFFVDYGNTALVPVSSLKQLPEALLSVPRMAVECCLCFLRPVSTSCGGAAWSKEANDFAKRRLTNKKFLAKVYSCVHGMARIELFDKQPGNDRLQNFNDLLLVKGFAVRALEPLESQEDHRMRLQYMYSSDRTCTPPGRVLGGPDSSFCSSSLSLSSALSTTSLGSSAFSARPTTRKSRLLGPYSPLQLQFHALQFNTLGKKVRIEPESVNSTALDMEPQNPHDRMLVSSFVSLSGSEEHLVARNTTLMPAVPGLLSICCLTFCHGADMRVSEDGCEYTGAIIGLGADPDTGYPAYPDDDIELAFDIPFTNHDLEKINKVRYLLNCMLSGPPGSAGALDPAALAERQKLLRTSLLQLLDEQKPYKRPETSASAYKWNVIPASSLLEPITEPDEMVQGTPVFPLHRGVALATHSTLSRLKRTDALVRAYNDVMRSASSGRHDNMSMWERCYACDASLVTLRDVGEHLDSIAHQDRVAALKRVHTGVRDAF
ncbi:ATP-dependent RNA helicase TDRD9 [Hyalella azteca]|uniref:Probable ATP-dependent RNA helicase spindle-E n=1 Tax=Hyalella azteca TaxID=294128 RepID=A0A8B7N1U0_HYAAZ|nr:ATP-dependent RNA helicase TDRD9 [Hyalella azteca]